MDIFFFSHYSLPTLRSDVLRGPDLTGAEGWLAISHSMEPRATDLHSDYIAFSRVTVNRLQRLIYSAITVVFAIFLGLAFFAFYQRNQLMSNDNWQKKQLGLLRPNLWLNLP